MITKLHLSNFRSIGPGFEIDLGPMTALVGPNGSGKSNIADALRFLADCCNGPLAQAIAARQGFRALRRSTSGAQPASVELCVEVTSGGSAGFWGFTLSSGTEADSFRVAREYAAWFSDASLLPSIDEFLRRFAAPEAPRGWDEGSGGGAGFFQFYRDALPPPKLTFPTGFGPMPDTMLLLPHMFPGGGPALVADLRSIAVYSLFPNSLRRPQAPDPAKPMIGSGDNWASALKAIDKHTWGSELAAGLGRLVDDIRDYRVVEAGGYLIPEFLHAMNGAAAHWRGASLESDGTLRVAAILTALFQEPAPSLLGFEEPELAVHPGALPVLYDFLREATARSQVLITTHSSDLLDLLPIDDVRVVTRREGCSTAARVEERQRDLVQRRLLSPSDLLHAEGLRSEGLGDDA